MSHFQKVSIDDLQTGMFVEAVVKQTGNLKITSQGTIKSKSVISWLKDKGILEVVVDVSKCVRLKADSFINLANSGSRLCESVPDTTAPAGNVDFKIEIKRASALYKNAKNIQKRLFNAIDKGLDYDLYATSKIVAAVSASLDRNANALLCMTQMREKGGYHYEHSVNCGVLMAAFAKAMGFEEAIVNELTLAGLLHDIGMVKIPAKIINKPGKLTAAEIKVMQQHVKVSVALLAPFQEVNETVLNTIRSHHERLDGTGYPLGISGDKISLYSRMLAIVDTYDAMISERPYKKPILAANALKLLLKYSESKYDRELVCKFIKCIGVYPIGSLVKLKSEKIAVITDLNNDMVFRPKVTAFYSTRSNHFLAKRTIDLGLHHSEEISEPTSARSYRIDYVRFFEEQLQAV
ncbi:HD-GYP domain-containing protein [Planctobacterium marinum]|uniref:HD-GYP domain-containing protein n=1 Tax=Planctobacterium marinum TaxID=1631968 RepID=UPI001E2A1571|nr:HD-GYP domain-containing protein [Planctobacterium marinum]MCC2604434.1 HD-GYP domain-containing protein [Planctobacterium marinum]